MDIRLDDTVKGIIFDYGGTIDSRGDHWSHIILDAYRREGIEIGIEPFKEAYVYGERALALEGAVAPGDTFRDLMLKKCRAEFECAGIDISDGRCEAVALRCYDYARECVDELRPTLEELSAKLPLVLVSNFYGNLNAVLRDFRLSHCFKAVVESAAVGVRKPDPAIFRLGLEALGLPAENVLVVGDSYSKDIVPARSLGCRTLHIEGRQWPPCE